MDKLDIQYPFLSATQVEGGRGSVGLSALLLGPEGGFLADASALAPVQKKSTIIISTLKKDLRTTIQTSRA